MSEAAGGRCCRARAWAGCSRQPAARPGLGTMGSFRADRMDGSDRGWRGPPTRVQEKTMPEAILLPARTLYDKQRQSDCERRAGRGERPWSWPGCMRRVLSCARSGFCSESGSLSAAGCCAASVRSGERVRTGKRMPGRGRQLRSNGESALEGGRGSAQ